MRLTNQNQLIYTENFSVQKRREKEKKKNKNRVKKETAEKKIERKARKTRKGQVAIHFDERRRIHRTEVPSKADTAIQDGVSASAVPRPLPVPKEDRPGYAASALHHHQAEFERCWRHHHQPSGGCQALPCHGQGSRRPERPHCPEKWRGEGVWYLSSLGWRCWPRQGEPAPGPWQSPLPGVKEGIAYYCCPGGRC